MHSALPALISQLKGSEKRLLTAWCSQLSYYTQGFIPFLARDVLHVELISLESLENRLRAKIYIAVIIDTKGKLSKYILVIDVAESFRQ